ncbi:MAG TPA: hypothetical protein VL856_02580 [Acidimicrobiia bacterium]|nr:hypothetical protein [Acidimicrobiia bacterium]
MRRPLALSVLATFALLTGCGSGGHKSESTPHKQPPCPLIAELDATAASITHADVSDPEAWARARDAVVKKYVATLQSLYDSVPDNLHHTIELMEAAVNQLRFDDAVAARPPLDEYAAATCGRTPDSASTSIGTGPTTTIASTATTAPSG